VNPGELTLLQQLRLARSEKLRRELAARILEVEPEPRCSRCGRDPDAGGGYSPGRAWCRECQNERCRILYRRRKEQRTRESSRAAGAHDPSAGGAREVAA
jgi:hypothetical protein